jgi:hypothetical protein
MFPTALLELVLPTLVDGLDVGIALLDLVVAPLSTAGEFTFRVVPVATLDLELE